MPRRRFQHRGGSTSFCPDAASRVGRSIRFLRLRSACGRLGYCLRRCTSWRSSARTRWATISRAGTIDVDATLPYFTPAAHRVADGTLGAVIRIREPFPNRRRSSTSASPVRLPVSSCWCRRFSRHGLSDVIVVAAGERSQFGEPLLFQFGALDHVRPHSGRPIRQHASDGVRGLVRDAGDGAEPAAVRAARRRPHHLRDARARSATPISLADRRRCGDRDDVLLDQLAAHDGDHGRDAVPARPAASARAERVTSRSGRARYCARRPRPGRCFVLASRRVPDSRSCSRNSDGRSSERRRTCLTARSSDRRRRSCARRISGRACERRQQRLPHRPRGACP